MRFSPLFLCLLFVRAAWAAPLPSLEGTITQTQNGLVTHANVVWRAPDTLKIEVQDSPYAVAQTAIARGDETLIYFPATRRILRYNFNLAKSWWRGSNLGSGGAANFLFAGTPFTPTNATYWQRDDVLFGGSGANAYYAATKSRVPRFAPQITVSSSSRLEKNGARTLLDAKITLDASSLPHQAQVVAGGEKTTFDYDLKPHPAAFPDAQFTFPDGIIREDTELRAPSAYVGNDVEAKFNQGVALVRNEDFPAALGAWREAAALQPLATAPHLTAFEVALSLRDVALAADELQKLEKLPPESAPSAIELGTRRARLALLQRDPAKAKAALDAALTAAPDRTDIQLLRADLARQSGDLAASRTDWQKVLASTAPDAQRIVSAQNLTFFASFDELPILLNTVPNQTDAQKLARSLLQLRSGAAPDTAAFSSNDMQVALALGLEAAGRDDDARKAWELVESRASDALRNRARAHLMTLASRRGDTQISLQKWRDWNATLTTPADRNDARDALFDAWQKAFRSDSLRAALGNRATATGATDDDLRLFLTYQERFGTADDVDVAVENGASRFPNSAFWAGRRAETLVVRAGGEGGIDAGLMRREQLYSQALALLDKAIASAPDEPFYRYQKALVATQRATKTGTIVDATVATRNRDLAKKETENLLAALPDDPDALVSSALQALAESGDGPSRTALQLATQALDTPPNDGDRHTLIWGARQAIATADRRLKQPAAAAAQWQTLLFGARDAGELSTLSASYFSLIEEAKDAQGAANLLDQVAARDAPYSEARAALEALAGRVALSPLADEISTDLSQMTDESAALAAATLNLKRQVATRRAVETPGAPAIADSNYDRAVRALSLSLARLRPVAQSPNRVLAARAAAFLAENAVLGRAERLQLLRQAIGTEPDDTALRFALIGALSSDEAKPERQSAMQTLDFDLETRRQLANAARLGDDAAAAFQIANEAFNIAARAPETNANSFQRVAFALAKAAASANQASRATELSNGLQLPQWNSIDRAAAFLSQIRTLQDAGKTDEASKLNPKVAALGLSKEEIDTAMTFMDEVEN